MFTIMAITKMNAMGNDERLPRDVRGVELVDDGHLGERGWSWSMPRTPATGRTGAHDRGNAAHLIKHSGQDHEHQRRAGFEATAASAEAIATNAAGTIIKPARHSRYRRARYGARTAQGCRSCMPRPYVIIMPMASDGCDIPTVHQLNAELAEVRRQVVCQAIKYLGA